MNNLDKQYAELLADVLANGTQKGDRTGTGNISVFGRTIRHKMSEGFPLLTTKKVYFKGILVELLWFLRGETNIKYMVDNGCNIWVGDAYKKFENVRNSMLQMRAPAGEEQLSRYIDWYEQVDTRQKFIEKIKTDDTFAKHHGELGPIYGKQWRNWEEYVPVTIADEQEFLGVTSYDGRFLRKSIDQIKELINKLKNNPEDRRMIVNAWNVADIPDMTLPPCHYSFQVYARPLSQQERWNMAGLTPNMNDFDYCDTLCNENNVPKYELSLMFNIRSNDVPLGLPFNLASYGLLLEILAKHVNMVPGELIASIGDAHIYLNQIPMMEEQLKREAFPLPVLKIADKEVKDISEYEIDDFEIVGYQSHEALKVPLSN